MISPEITELQSRNSQLSFIVSRLYEKLDELEKRIKKLEEEKNDKRIKNS